MRIDNVGPTRTLTGRGRWAGGVVRMDASVNMVYRTAIAEIGRGRAR
jgi:hypothetical protein